MAFNLLIIAAFVLVVTLFTGPGLWSNSSELPVVHIWRWLKRTKSARKP